MLTKSSVLERILRPSEGNLPPDFARRVLELNFAPADHDRYRELSLRVQSGQLSEEERLELDDLLTANDVLTILHAKALSSLKDGQSAA